MKLNPRFFLLFIAGILFSLNSQAVSVIKCVTADGETSFGNQRCDESASEEVLEISGDENVIESGDEGKADKNGGSGSSGTTVVGEGGGSGGSGGSGSAGGSGGSGSGGGGGGGGGGSGDGSGGSGGGTDGGGNDGGSKNGGGSDGGSNNGGGSDNTNTGGENTTTTTNTGGGGGGPTPPPVTPPPPPPPPPPQDPPPINTQAPIVNGTSGTVAQDATLQINGNHFTEKVIDRPYFYWKADLGGATGENPSSLGVKNSWDQTNFNGTKSTTVVAPGSTNSMVFDHSASSGGMLSRVDFESDKLYIWRKVYDDFDLLGAQALLARMKDYVGALPVAGQVLKGQETGATAIVQSHNINVASGSGTVFFEPVGGKLNDTPRVKFKATAGGVTGEVVELFTAADTGFTTPLATMRSNDGYGVRINFNNKIIRLWSPITNVVDGSRNNIYAALAVNQDNQYNIIFPEYTGTSGQYFTMTHKGKVWKVDEFVYQTSDVNSENGIFQFFQDGYLNNSGNKKHRTRDTDNPHRYGQLFQYQVSNGAQLGALRYMDSLYVDTTWHRVILCNGATINTCTNRQIQIPKTWTNGFISVQVNTGGLDLTSNVYLYVTNSYGDTNPNGYLVLEP